MTPTTVNFNTLVGKTITAIHKTPDADGNASELQFECSDGSQYHMYHDQCCCENVYLYDTNGELDAIIGLKIHDAYESSSASDDGTGCAQALYSKHFDPNEHDDDSCTWTFYRIVVSDGRNSATVVLRWLGTSNGYYSESMAFDQIAEPAEDAQ
jgi:hypothetical protein